MLSGLFFRNSIFGLIFTLFTPIAVQADHNCGWAKSSAVNVLADVYAGNNLGFVRDSLVGLNVSQGIATKMVQWASRVAQYSQRRTAEYCEYRKNAPNNGGLGQVFGTGPMNFNACMAQYGVTNFKEDLRSNMGCSGTIIGQIGHTK